MLIFNILIDDTLKVVITISLGALKILHQAAPASLLFPDEQISHTVQTSLSLSFRHHRIVKEDMVPAPIKRIP